jgi:hypothetical protein
MFAPRRGVVLAAVGNPLDDPCRQTFEESVVVDPEAMSNVVTYGTI